MDLYTKVIEYVDKSFGRKMLHFERTVYWIEQLIPNTTEAHRISAYSHDIERAFRNPLEKTAEGSSAGFQDDYFTKYHPEKGAEIMGQFLEKEGASKETIDKVKHLISKHEVGGDDEQNALMDADSISFLETNAKHFVEERVKTEGYGKVKEKLDWMFNRISTEEHKKFTKENYEKWSKELENIK